MSDSGGSDDLLRDNQTLRERVGELEDQNHDLASLYVASVQLHATLELRTVLRTIVEILLNFVGAKTFAVYIVDERAQRLRALGGHNVDRQALPQPALGEPGLGEQALAGQPYYADTMARADPRRSAPLVVVPLRLGGRGVGAIAIWELLAHKTSLDDVDYDLFNLLGAHAAGALEAARLASAASGGPGFGGLPDLI
jgi:nitrate/nitrite-specific signal transduction histidine kinase